MAVPTTDSPTNRTAISTQGSDAGTMGSKVEAYTLINARRAEAMTPAIKPLRAADRTKGARMKPRVAPTSFIVWIVLRRLYIDRLTVLFYKGYGDEQKSCGAYERKSAYPPERLVDTLDDGILAHYLVNTLK